MDGRAEAPLRAAANVCQVRVQCRCLLCDVSLHRDGDGKFYRVMLSAEAVVVRACAAFCVIVFVLFSLFLSVFHNYALCVQRAFDLVDFRGVASSNLLDAVIDYSHTVVEKVQCLFR